MSIDDASPSIAFARPKSSTFTASSLRHLHIRGLQVPMHDAALVRVFQRFANLLRNPQRFINGNRPRFDAIRQRRPFDKLHHQRMRISGIFETVNRRNIGMIQRGEDFCFALESRHAFDVARERIGQDLQRHIASQLRIPRAIYLAHPARTNGTSDFVRADFGSRRNRHFFSPACQLSTTLNGVVSSRPASFGNRKRAPSGAASHAANIPGLAPIPESEKRAFGAAD